MKHTNVAPPNSKLINEGGLYINQNDLIYQQKLVRGSKEHLQMILASGKLYGPMTEAQQIEAVEYAYGIKAPPPRPRVVFIGRHDND